MNKFNKRQGSAVKVRKIKGRATKKRVGAAKRHKKIAEVSSGQRTGKTARKRVKVQRLKVRGVHSKNVLASFGFNLLASCKTDSRNLQQKLCICTLNNLHVLLQEKEDQAAQGLLDTEMKDAPKMRS